jgi:hypothetical protein
MSFQFYKVLHMIGLMTLFFGFGGLLVATYAGIVLSKKARIMTMVTHGVGLLLILISGFGMAARLGYMAQLPSWIHAKLLIWVLMGAGIALVKRRGQIGWPITVLLIGLGGTAAFIAVNKPF